MTLRMDLHMHSTISDGTDTPAELLENVRKAGIELFALTDHDAVKGCGALRGLLRGDGPMLLSGAEFSCRDEEGKYHILGYRFDPEHPAILRVVETGHGYRMNKLRTRLESLEKTYGFAFPGDAVRRLLTMDNPGKPHIANLMVELGYAKSREEAIGRYINLCPARSEYVRPEEAIRGILESGGIPVLAHPAFGSGDQRITGETMERRLRRLTGFGLRGVEGFYPKYTPMMREEILAFAERFGLLITAGSDYHGTNKPVALGDTGLDPAQPLPAGLLRFLEEVGAR